MFPSMKNHKLKISSNGKVWIPDLYPSVGQSVPAKSMPNPTPEMLNNDPVFDAIWEVIKNWDINVPEYYRGYMGGTGSHVTLIYDALMKVLPKP